MGFAGLNPSTGRSSESRPARHASPGRLMLGGDSPYCSGRVAVKFPLVPLSLIWLLPKLTIEPNTAFTLVPLPPRVDEPTFMDELLEPVLTPYCRLATRLDSSIVK